MVRVYRPDPGKALEVIAQCEIRQAGQNAVYLFDGMGKIGFRRAVCGHGLTSELTLGDRLVFKLDQRHMSAVISNSIESILDSFRWSFKYLHEADAIIEKYPRHPA